MNGEIFRLERSYLVVLGAGADDAIPLVFMAAEIDLRDRICVAVGMESK